MINMDFSILKRNISMLMEQASMSQQDLADLLGMTQSGVSKCLKPDDESRRFTLEQVCRIADHFNVSLDDLVGIKPADRKLSSREICSFIVALFESHIVKNATIEKSEVIYTPAPPNQIYGDRQDRDVPYNALYFPGYYLLDDDDPSISVADWDVIQYEGNELSQNTEINNFLQKFIDAFDKYETGVYDEEAYRILLEAYFKILNK